MKFLIFLALVTMASSQINFNVPIIKRDPSLTGSFRLNQPQPHKFDFGSGLQYKAPHFRAATNYDQSFDKLKTINAEAGYIRVNPQTRRQLEVYGTASKTFSPQGNTGIMPGVGIKWTF